MAFFIIINTPVMKKHFLFVLCSLLAGFWAAAQVTTNPTPVVADQAATLFFNKAGTPLSGTADIRAYMGVTVNGTPWQNIKGGGNWSNGAVLPQLTLVSGTTYKLDITPDLYTYFGVPTTSSITQICLVLRNVAGTAQTSPDIFIPVGAFQMTLNAPAVNSTSIVSSGGSLSVSASNTGGNAAYDLKANGVSINTATTAAYSFTDTNITTNKVYELSATLGSVTHTRKFFAMVDPGTIDAVLPTGMEDGINYGPDPTKATLVLTAPGKDFVYVAGSFNGWVPDASHAMRKDPGTGKFWLELTGLTPGAFHTYQYWVVDKTPLAGSPALVKAADPFSTLVLSPFDDPEIIDKGVYPGLPEYPEGQEREVTVLQTGQAPYDWQVENFQKPSKEKLTVYEVLVRDFDADRSYQDLIDKIDYFKNLNINAIELMPVMEYEGNESWGYNTTFHMANDKFYGPGDKLKAFIDLCHQNGIAVILDVALNHAFGRNPMVRMWMNDPDGDGWGGPSSENPYFNQTAMHSYSVGEDFNHTSAYTRYYVKRVIEHWIGEYHIDGFRWDLTKGFTQNCMNNEGCTNSYQQDRVDVLKLYADYSWAVDPTHYVIFEHLGPDNEESQWANYRLGETPSKGVMMWGNVTGPYGQLSMGFNTDANISRIGHMAHSGFAGKRVMGYAESHDEERLMYKNLEYGNSTNASHNVKTLNVALSRMSAIGAVSLLVPGPKMIWHFADLGMENSIFTCSDGSVNKPDDAIAGDCKLATKPQPQWTGNWLANANRNKIYNDWARMIGLKRQEAVFDGEYALNTGNIVTPRLYVYNNGLPTSQLKNIVVLTNFGVSSQSVVADFPYAGTWYNLMDNTSVNVTNPGMSLTIPAGQFRVYGNQPVTLSTDDVAGGFRVSLYPNPAAAEFVVDTDTDTVEIYTVTGQRVKTFGARVMGEIFDVRDLNAGVYLVKVIRGDRHKTVRLVKE